MEHAVRPPTHPGSPSPDGRVLGLADELAALRESMIQAQIAGLSRTADVHAAWTESAANLLHYIVLRRHDMREVQEALAELGLSSLGRSESHVLANLDAVLGALRRISGDGPAPRASSTTAGVRAGADLLAAHAEDLLGPPPVARRVRILVTLPAEAAEDYALVRDLVANGMDCARINCAHDSAAVWARMISNVERARRDLGQPCRGLMDLAGPKLRTGATEPGPCVLKVKPDRDVFGRVRASARIWLDAGAEPPAPATARIAVEPTWLAHLREGDRVTFVDARESRRALTVGVCTPGGAWVESAQTAYFVPQTRLRIERDDATPRETPVGLASPSAGDVRVRPGDTIVVTRPEVAGRPATCDEQGAVVAPARIPCTLPEAFPDVRPGERIFFDDGLVGGVVRDAGGERLFVEITDARPKGEKLRPDKGINLPDANLRLAAVTEKDFHDLDFVAAHADAVALSFLRAPEDLDVIQKRLAELGRADLGVVLKIETRPAFERLPALLLAAMRSPRVGVMIARGDLAVEMGHERLAEVQEEILWFCEAAHVPTIWATQVLENLAKEGRPSRAEITDAAMGERAECVMLNKGPHVVAAVRTLDDILRRMEAHHSKKRSMLRSLRTAQEFAGDRS